MRRALLVGIDHYDNGRHLGGCVNDALALEPLLTCHSDELPNFAPRVHLGRHTREEVSRVTREALSIALDDLLAPGAQTALFYFSGHGAGTGTGADLWLATSDATSTTPGIKFTELLERVNAPGAPETVLVLLDCCFSGAAGGVPAALASGVVLRHGLAMLTSSRPEQASIETQLDVPDGSTGGLARGLFSTFLEDGLAGGAGNILGQVTVAGLYAYLSEAFGPWEQRPMFKANVDRLTTIRRVTPQVPITTIRRIPRIFPDALGVLPLDPRYEPDKRLSGLSPDPEREAVFSELQALRAVGLVEPVGEEHLYFAAMNRTGCRLTHLGRHYHHLVTKGLV